MSQRDSGYARLENDAYNTPAWCTQALLPHLPARPPVHIHEPASGAGPIVRELERAGYMVSEADIERGRDFLQQRFCLAAGIVTNPPYGKAQEFIEHAIALMKPRNGFVAMLLRSDYDHAATRQHLFCHPFAKRVVLTKRIRWIEGSTGSPSFNHAWMLWDWRHKGPPTIAYEPR